MAGRGAFRLLETAANGQPALALYARAGATGDYLAHSIQVLSLREERIAVMVNFKDPALFGWFGLAARLTV
jgi:RNA polymerase sigma-70 factor, ECF subfamily